jgi:hypothetical protein
MREQLKWWNLKKKSKDKKGLKQPKSLMKTTMSLL